MTRRTALITGATSGIGKVTAQRLSSDFHVLVGGRDRAAAEAVCASLPSAEPFVADLANAEDVARAAQRVEALDVLVHSAAILTVHPLEQLTRDHWRELFEVNVFAVADLTRLLLPALKASRGTVVMINSTSGLCGHGPGGVYSASKFALHAFTESLRDEVRADGVRVSAVHPGRVATPMQESLRAAEGLAYVPEDYLSPESVAAAVQLAVMTDASSCVESVTLRPSP